MRLLFLSNVHPNPLAPGKGTFNGALIRALGQQHDVHVVCPVSWVDQLRARQTVLPSTPILLQPTVTASYPIFWYPPKMLRAQYDRFLELSIQRRVERDLKTFRPDAVLSYWAHPDGAVALRIARRLGVPAISMVGGSDVLLIGKKCARRTAILNTLVKSDAVIAVSSDIAQQVVADGVDSKRVFVVRRGVDENVFCPGDRNAARRRLGLPLDAQILVGVGRLVPVKDWPALVTACGHLQQQGQGVRCYLLGDGAGRPALERQINELGLRGNFELRGGQSQAVLADWYRAADLVVLPSLSEGIPNVLLEAIACGAAFVATNVGGIPEIADPEFDQLVSPAEPIRLADAIQERLGLKWVQSRHRAKPQSWQDSAEKVVDIIQSCRRTRHVATSASSVYSSADAAPDVERVTEAISTPPNMVALNINPFRQGVKAVMSAVLPRERWMTCGPATATGIALTFDDGPHPEYTPLLLDELWKYQIRATFFVVGQAVARFPHLAKRIIAEGHTLGCHTFTHSEPAQTSAKTLKDEVRRSLALIEDLTGQRLTLFRPPKGKLSLSKTLGLWKLQQSIVLWNQDPRDYRADSVVGIQPWVQHYQPTRGDIVLLHDTHPHCINAIEPFVQLVADHGLGDFQTIDQWLLSKKRIARRERDDLVLETTSSRQVQIVKQGYPE